jgi:hypothetical protein
VATDHVQYISFMIPNKGSQVAEFHVVLVERTVVSQKLTPETSHVTDGYCTSSCVVLSVITFPSHCETKTLLYGALVQYLHRSHGSVNGQWIFILINLYLSRKNRRSTVSTATKLRAGRPGIDSRQRQENFPFATASRLTVGPIQPSIKWVPGALSPEVRQPGCEADHPPPSSAEVNVWSYTSTPPHFLMVWYMDIHPTDGSC